jgi:hypothetical protein
MRPSNKFISELFSHPDSYHLVCVRIGGYSVLRIASVAFILLFSVSLILMNGVLSIGIDVIRFLAHYQYVGII